MQHVTLRRLADQFVIDWADLDRHRANDLPLDGGGQRNPQAVFQPFQPVHRESTTVTQYGDHAADGHIVLLVTYAAGSFRREHFAAEIAPQLFQFINGGFDRRSSNQAHQHARFALDVDFAALTLRTAVSGFEGGMGNLDLGRSAIRFSAMSAVTRRFGFGPRRWFIGPNAGALQHRCGFLRLRRTQQVPQRLKCGLLIFQQRGDVTQRPYRCL